MSPEVQNRGISGPAKRTYVLQIFFKKVRNLNVDGKEGRRVNYIYNRNVICIAMGLLLDVKTRSKLSKY